MAVRYEDAVLGLGFWNLGSCDRCWVSNVLRGKSTIMQDFLAYIPDGVLTVVSAAFGWRTS